MGSRSFVKSESWLDISRIEKQVDRRQAEDEQCEQSSSRFRSPPQARRRPTERAFSLEPTLRSSVHVDHDQQGNKREHLLIRLRQQSFLARSDSATLSSNLSQSIDLDGSLVDRASSTRVVECERPAREQGDQTNSNGPAHEINSSRRELSLGLKSFRDRFERRWQRLRHSQTHQRRALELGPGHVRRRSRESSPFARSWSSLSEQVSSRLTNIGHACKSLLYECQQPECDQSQVGSFTPRARQLAPSDANRTLSPMPVTSQISSIVRDHDQLNVSRFRERLTSEWVARQFEAHRNDLNLEGDSENENPLIG